MAWKYQYVHEMLGAYKRAFAILKAGGRIAMRWGESDLDLAGFQQEFRRALDRRINLKVSDGKPRGRRDCYEYDIAAWRDSRRIREILTRRIRHYHFETAEARTRFGHLLARYDD